MAEVDLQHGRWIEKSKIFANPRRLGALKLAWAAFP